MKLLPRLAVSVAVPRLALPLAAPLLALPLAVLALAGCGSSSSSSSSSAPAASAPAASAPAATSAPSAAGGTQVTIQGFAFSPLVIHAKVGHTIVWTNKDMPPHNVTYVSGPKFTSSANLGTGATYSLKLTQAGSITYFCSIHPFMKHGTIVVTQ